VQACAAAGLEAAAAVSGSRTTVRGARVVAVPTGAPHLRVVAGLHTGAVFTVTDAACIVGKAADAHIRLTDSGVSRHHAKLVRASDGLLMVVDLQSTNGTFVNGGRVEVATLRAGHRLRIGPDAELELGYGDPPSADESAQPEPPADMPLTAREREIAELVAEGLTNPQIAERLGVKRRTVASHLDNIYARLQVANRAALTRWLLERRRPDRS
jgi:DNA-binding CsgD family transcriptional regulator